MPAAREGGATPSLTRRRLLAGLGGVAVSAGAVACTAGGGPGPSPPTTPTPTRTPDPDARRRTDAVATTYRLVVAYEATIAVHPALATSLRPLLSDHSAHLRAVSPEPVTTPSPTSPSSGAGSTGAGSPSIETTATETSATDRAATSSPPASTAVPVPPDPAAARAALQALEQVSSDTARDDAVTAVDPALARLLASIAASRAVHAVQLAPPA